MTQFAEDIGLELAHLLVGRIEPVRILNHLGGPGVFLFLEGISGDGDDLVTAAHKSHHAICFLVGMYLEEFGDIVVEPADGVLVDRGREMNVLTVALGVLCNLLQVGRVVDLVPDLVRAEAAQYAPQRLVEGQGDLIHIPR